MQEGHPKFDKAPAKEKAETRDSKLQAAAAEDKAWDELNASASSARARQRQGSPWQQAKKLDLNLE